MSTRWIYFPLFLVIVQGWAVAGCGDATSSADDEPIHLHVICLASADGLSVTCEGSERLARFNTWTNEAMYKPESTFTIWAVGSSRHRYHLAACIPPKWGSNVWHAKADFIAKARQAVNGRQPGLTVPESCRPPGSQTPGVHQLEVSPAAAPLHRDVWQKVVSGSAAPPLHMAVVCDRSTSTLNAACNPDALLRAFDLWVAESLALPGSSLSVDVIGTSHDPLRSVYHLRIPEHPVGERVAFILGGRAELARLLPESLERNASAIAEGFSASVRTLRERGGRYRLVVLSDLRQLTPSVWNFDHTVPPPPTFIKWLKQTRLIADLREIPVLVCGIHSRRSPEGNGHYTATRAAQLQEVWKQAFQAMGASEVKMFTSCDAGLSA